MSDIVERLRKWSVFGYGYEASCDMKEAASEIEGQRASVANAARLLSEQTDEITRLRADRDEAYLDLSKLMSQIDALRARNAELEEALRDIASGKYSGVVLTSMPPQDPAVVRARAAIAKGENNG